jgi:hypothetical protein
MCVCEEDAVCCTFDWDALCVNAARNRCDACGGGGGDDTTSGGTTTGVADTGDTGGSSSGDDGGMAGDCCTPSPMPGCPADPAIEMCVCALDAFCCDNEWDAQCTQEADQDCAAGCAFGTDCCMPHPTAGCDDMAVETCVCNEDPFCCDQEWDGLCVDQVTSLMCGMC